MEETYCFGGNPLDRMSERRDDGEWIAARLADPGARMLPLRDLKPFARNGSTPALDWQPVAPWRDHIEAGATLLNDVSASLWPVAAEAGVGVLWATHLIEEVGPGDRVVVLHRGRVLAQDTREGLVAGQGAADLAEAFGRLVGLSGTAEAGP